MVTLVNLSLCWDGAVVSLSVQEHRGVGRVQYERCWLFSGVSGLGTEFCCHGYLDVIGA